LNKEHADTASGVVTSGALPYMVLHAAGSAGPARGAVVATGNLVEIRDCPAAVSGNDRRHMHWAPGLGSDGQ